MIWKWLKRSDNDNVKGDVVLLHLPVAAEWRRHRRPHVVPSARDLLQGKHMYNRLVLSTGRQSRNVVRRLVVQAPPPPPRAKRCPLPHRHLLLLLPLLPVIISTASIAVSCVQNDSHVLSICGPICASTLGKNPLAATSVGKRSRELTT